nr:DUF3304 domain-containing protein [Massilia eburnea]
MATACNANSSNDTGKLAKKEKYGLTIVGYNYTSRYIDEFSVDGQGGGNLHVSGPNGGGGGLACCAAFWPAVKKATVTVRWQSDACRYLDSVDDDGTKHWLHHSWYKEREVPVTVHVNGEPAYMEIHIYPDDRVEAIVTDAISEPRLKLNKEREDRTEYSRCQNDKEPK